MGSCVFSHVKENLKDHQFVTLFSGNCSGQNENRYIHETMSLLTIKIQKLKEIQLIFLEKGYTQNANDSMHSTIEQAKRRIKIFHPYQWKAVVQLACKSNPYNVKVMCQDEFLDFTTPLGTDFSNIINKKLIDLGGKRGTVKWSQLRQVCLLKSTKHKVKIMYNYDLSTSFQVAVIGSLKKPSTRKSLSAVYDMNLAISKACKSRLHITQLLKKDLLGLCSSNAIPPNYHEYYHNLSTDNVIGDDPGNIDSDLDHDAANSDNE